MLNLTGPGKAAEPPLEIIVTPEDIESVTGPEMLTTIDLAIHDARLAASRPDLIPESRRAVEHRRNVRRLVCLEAARVVLTAVLMNTAVNR